MTAPDFLWHSAAPWDNSGYGRQTDLVVRSLLSRGYRVELSVPTGGGRVEVGPFRCWPADFARGVALQRNLEEVYHSGEDKPRALIYTDFVRLDGQLFDGIGLAMYLTFNFDPPPPDLLRFLRERRPRLAVPSKWAHACLQSHGVESTFIPHGIDMRIFNPGSGEDRLQARHDMGVDSDAFVVGVVAVNNEWESNRKSLPEALAAFAEFRRRHDDAVLFLHTEVTGRDHRGIDLRPILESLAVPPSAVVATRPDRYALGVPQNEMPSLFRGLDVLLAPSAGEGFGIPVVESQACGVPVIVSDFSAQPELVGSGWTVGGQRRWAPFANSWLFTPDIEEVVDCLGRAHSGPRPPFSPAVEFAQAFDHDRLIDERWAPFIDSWLKDDESGVR